MLWKKNHTPVLRSTHLQCMQMNASRGLLVSFKILVPWTFIDCASTQETISEATRLSHLFFVFLSWDCFKPEHLFCHWSGGKTRSRARRFWNRFSCKGHSAGHRATLQHSKGKPEVWAYAHIHAPICRDLWQGVLFLGWFMIFKSCAFLAFVGFYLVQQDAFIDAEEKLVSALGNRCSTCPTPNPHRRTCFGWAHWSTWLDLAVLSAFQSPTSRLWEEEYNARCAPYCTSSKYGWFLVRKHVFEKSVN